MLCTKRPTFNTETQAKGKEVENGAGFAHTNQKSSSLTSIKQSSHHSEENGHLWLGGPVLKAIASPASPALGCLA